MNPPSDSGISAFAHVTNQGVSKYYFAKDDVLADSAARLDQGWLTMVRCKTAKDYSYLDKLSEFQATNQCEKLNLSTFDRLSPANLKPGKKAPVQLSLEGGGAKKKSSLLASFGRSIQGLMMPIQVASSVLWSLYIFQMVKSDSGASFNSLTKFGKNLVITPIVSSFKLLTNGLTGNPLTLEKFFLSAKQMTEAEHLARFLEFLSHPKQQVYYAEDMARQFAAFIKINKDTRFMPEFLRGLSPEQLRVALLDPSEKKALARLFVQAKGSRLGFDLGWFKTKNEWLVGNKFLPKLIDARELDQIDDLVAALKYPGAKIKGSEAVKKAQKIYRQLRPAHTKLANKLVVVGIWMVVAKVGWEMFNSAIAADGKVIAAQLLAKQFSEATLNAHQNIKSSPECTSQLKRALEVFDRKTILQTTFSTECGNLVKELNTSVADVLTEYEFLNDQELLKAFEGVSLIAKTVPDLIEVSFEATVLP